MQILNPWELAAESLAAKSALPVIFDEQLGALMLVADLIREERYIEAEQAVATFAELYPPTPDALVVSE